MVSELEDLSASIDVQDVYTKVKCKVESFSIDHYQSRSVMGTAAGALGLLELLTKRMFLFCTQRTPHR